LNNIDVVFRVKIKIYRLTIDGLSKSASPISTTTIITINHHNRYYYYHFQIDYD